MDKNSQMSEKYVFLLSWFGFMQKLHLGRVRQRSEKYVELLKYDNKFLSHFPPSSLFAFPRTGYNQHTWRRRGGHWHFALCIMTINRLYNWDKMNKK